MIRRPPRSTLSSSSAASDVYKRQHWKIVNNLQVGLICVDYLIHQLIIRINRLLVLYSILYLVGKLLFSLHHIIYHYFFTTKPYLTLFPQLSALSLNTPLPFLEARS
eukprot:TRINITY_DN10952_c0_g3_i3.p3 TRINITY_DN10952_c0_g3~~TRINITY_DN10952_c0_g3_i3.p3  ORF type:complete len:114 (-),score=3.25 TRINITY_DN10952_c0_g3_i3:1284-1604(-)